MFFLSAPLLYGFSVVFKYLNYWDLLYSPIDVSMRCGSCDTNLRFLSSVVICVGLDLIRIPVLACDKKQGVIRTAHVDWHLPSGLQQKDENHSKG
ncbi:hypothetical protein OPV22_033482 [Ensete ventricosum]|uniref:Uncharacterized protein n=1 Tax=Ensete ventricosum TaxID=4639 RepID=A0AAV8P0Y2_ENSVE|nr:hypothetical protein OPV22_033482 [Ensete ventricosum]